MGETTKFWRWAVAFSLQVLRLYVRGAGGPSGSGKSSSEQGLSD